MLVFFTGTFDAVCAHCLGFSFFSDRLVKVCVDIVLVRGGVLDCSLSIPEPEYVLEFVLDPEPISGESILMVTRSAQISSLSS